MKIIYFYLIKLMYVMDHMQSILYTIMTLIKMDSYCLFNLKKMIINLFYSLNSLY
jgi:hypothetical protein